MIDLGLSHLAAQVLAGLARVGGSLATAESLTGGQLAAAVTGVPGASAAYLGGVVSYATEVKIAVLGVPESLVAAYGVVSPECALAMAQGVAALTGSTYAVATTGVAGPGRQEDRPAGTVHVALLTPTGHRLLALHLPGDRAAVQSSTCREALAGLAHLLGPTPG